MAISKVTSGGIADGTLSVEDIADDAVTAAKLANSINTDIATGVTGNTTANAALPKAGGSMTGTITGFTSTGIDDNATSTAITIDSAENVGIGASPSYKLDVNAGAPSSADKIISRHMAETSRQLGLVWDDSASTMGIATLTNHSLAFYTNGINPRMIIDNTGAVTMPSQPAFSVKATSSQLNIASGTTIAFGTEVFDQNSDFLGNTFTAPVTGKYQLNVLVRIDDCDTAASYSRVYMKTSNRDYQIILDLGGFSADPNYWGFNFSVLADMDAGDTVYLQYSQSSGSVQADILPASYFTGYLAC